jgi:hypothetical protein
VFGLLSPLEIQPSDFKGQALFSHIQEIAAPLRAPLSLTLCLARPPRMA